jgi:hypothetical protein
VLAAGLAGAAGPIYQDRHQTDELPLFMSVTIIQSLVLLISLSLLRPGGLRLARIATTQAQADIADSVEPT